MESVPSAPFRYRPPELGDGIVLRPRLLAIMRQRFERRLVVVVGSGGFGKTTLLAHAIENNRVEAILSLPGGVFQPYSGVKTSVLFFRKGGATERVLFLHADHDGYKLDANHDTPIAPDDLPDLIAVYQHKNKRWAEWEYRDPAQEWAL